MTEPVMEPPKDPMSWNPAHAVIQQVGKRKYEIYISHGLLRYGGEFGGPYRYGYDRAQKKADRMLAKYLRDRERRENVIEIWPGPERR
jgi:hypothetical protein